MEMFWFVLAIDFLSFSLALIYPKQTHPGDTDQKAVCDGKANSNSGCATTQWSKASYGDTFEAAGGGAFVMKWDENSIDVCTSLYCFPLF
jgi:hypothetical protein